MKASGRVRTLSYEEWVARMKAAGAIMVGKVTTPEFGHKPMNEAPLFGVTHNPWDLSRTPGGSSGGSAAAVAAAMFFDFAYFREQTCIVACPYGSRSFNWRDPREAIAKTDPEFPTRSKGVVEKCTFCEERLAKGQMPACVGACKEKCLVFGDLEDAGSKVREVLARRHAIRRKPGLGTQPEVYYLV